MTETRTRAETEVLEDLAARAAAAEVYNHDETGVLSLTVPPGAEHRVVSLEDFRSAPSRARGTAHFFTAAGFAAYVNRHKGGPGERVTLWADPRLADLVALLNDHGPNRDPGWGDHRAALDVRPSPEWELWTKHDGRLMPQDDFAELVEVGAPAIVEPDAATMLELAHTFHATNRVNFRSDRRVESGQVQLTYEETIEAKAGQTGSLEVPTTFALGVAPFDGGAKYRVDARLRYRINEGNLRIGYALLRPDDARREAFAELVAEVEAATELAAWPGLPS